MRAVLFSLAATLLAAQAAAAALSPVTTRQVGGDYARIAACAYDRLRDGEFAEGLRLVDLRGANRIEIGFNLTTSMLGQAVTPVWRLDIAGAGQGRSSLAIAAVPTIWGPDYYARRILAAIAPCLSPAP